MVGKLLEEISKIKKSLFSEYIDRPFYPLFWRQYHTPNIDHCAVI